MRDMFLLGLLGLALVALASCQGGDRPATTPTPIVTATVAPTPAPTPMPTPTPVATATPTATPAPTPLPTPSPTPAPTPTRVSILIEGFAFAPSSITISKGTIVTWTNRDAARHTITGSGFDSVLLSQGQSFTYTFNETGTFSYHCTPHPSMRGEVIVR